MHGKLRKILSSIMVTAVLVGGSGTAAYAEESAEPTAASEAISTAGSAEITSDTAETNAGGVVVSTSESDAALSTSTAGTVTAESLSADTSTEVSTASVSATVTSTTTDLSDFWDLTAWTTDAGYFSSLTYDESAETSSFSINGKNGVWEYLYKTVSGLTPGQTYTLYGVYEADATALTGSFYTGYLPLMISDTLTTGTTYATGDLGTVELAVQTSETSFSYTFTAPESGVVYFYLNLGYLQDNVTSSYTFRNVAITFDSNGGNGEMSTQFIPGLVDDSSGTAINANEFTYTGYEFSGWNTEADGSGTSYDDGATISDLTSDITLYAQWTANQYTVTCEDWLVDADNNRKVLLGSQTAEYNYGSTAYGSDWGGATAIRTYYYGRYQYESCTSATVETSGTTVYRYFWAWTDINIYNAEGIQDGETATFSLSTDDGVTWKTGLQNEETGDVFHTIMPYGTTYLIKDLSPVRSYEKLDYYSDNLKYDNSTGIWTYTPTIAGTEMNFYMKYKNFTVAFDSNGGTGSMDDESITYGTATVLTANEFTRTGYKFTGWNTEADGSGTDYTDEQEISDITSDLTLYAQWEYVPVTVSIPSSIKYENMDIGTADTSDTYNVIISDEGGQSVTIQGTMNSPGNDIEYLDGSSVSSQTSPITTNTSTTATDTVKISGKATYADKYTGSIQYTVTVS